MEELGFVFEEQILYVQIVYVLRVKKSLILKEAKEQSKEICKFLESDGHICFGYSFDEVWDLISY